MVENNPISFLMNFTMKVEKGMRLQLNPLNAGNVFPASAC